MPTVNTLAGILALILAQTTAVQVTAQVPLETLMSKEWTVTWTKDAETQSADGAALTFAEQGKLSGFGGCNRLIASYTLDNETGTLTISSVGSTRKLCAGKIMNFEKSFIQSLRETASVKTGEAGDVTLSNAAGAPLLVLN